MAGTSPAMTAEKPPQLRKLWLCADDYGISPAVNRAIRDLIGRGRINATSVMVTTPSFSAAEAQALSDVAGPNRRPAIGLHFTLTAPFRPSDVMVGADKVTLEGPEVYFTTPVGRKSK